MAGRGSVTKSKNLMRNDMFEILARLSYVTVSPFFWQRKDGTLFYSARKGSN
jgi:hypothetical protein